MAMPETNEEPLFSLVTKAHTLANMLANMGMTTNAQVVRELVKRVVPVKVVPTRPHVRPSRSKPSQFVADPIRPPDGKTWCEQCQKLVTVGCQSRFCKVTS